MQHIKFLKFPPNNGARCHNLFIKCHCRRQILVVTAFIMWTTEKNLKLMEDLHSMPCLWDVGSPAYKDRCKKVDATDTLAKKYDCSPADMEKKIHSFKSQFRREHKRLTDAKKSGSSPKKCNWFGYEPLLFLLPSSQSRGSRSTDMLGKTLNDDSSGGEGNSREKIQNQSKEQLPEEIDITNDENETCESQELVKRPRKKSNNDDVFFQDALNCMKTLSDAVSQRDKYTVYGEHVAHKLRSCGRNNVEIAIAQHHIDNILFNLSIGIYCENSQNFSRSENSSRSTQCHQSSSSSSSNQWTSNPPAQVSSDTTEIYTNHTLQTFFDEFSDGD